MFTHTSSCHKTKHRGKNLRDRVLLPSACYCAQSAFLCPSPLSSSPPPLSDCFSLFTTSTFTPLFVPPQFFILISSSASSLYPLPCKRHLQPRWTEGKARAREHLSSIRFVSLSSLPFYPIPLPFSLPPFSSLLPCSPRPGSQHFSMRWGGEHTQRAYCSPNKPGGEQQREVTGPRESKEVGSDPHCLRQHLGMQHCGKTGIVCAPDGAFNKDTTCWHLSLFSWTVRKSEFCIWEAFVNSWYGSGLKLDWTGFICGLECWWEASELWDIVLCSRTTLTCLVSPRCQSCLGECVLSFTQ